MIRLENDNTELHYDRYVTRGDMMYLRSALPLDDPDQLYNYLKNSSVLSEANLTPEDFGVWHPVTEWCKHNTREQIISTLTELVLENERLKQQLSMI